MTEQIRHIYPHVLAAITSRPWAIHPATMNVILEIMEMRAGGLRLSPDEITERLAAAKEVNGPRRGGGRQANVAVIPIYGVITPRATGMNASGASSVESIREDFRMAMDDPKVDALVFDVDSPGGVVDGLPELFDEIMSARGTKPMTAVANTQMASGALWLASAADRVVASPSARVGSIGVIGIHEERTEQYAKEGIRHTVIRTAPYKGEGSRVEPLTEEAKDAMLAEAMEYDAMFVEGLANARSTHPDRVRAEFGQGRMMSPQRATDVGLIDGIETLEGAITSTAEYAVGGQYGAVDGSAGWFTKVIAETEMRISESLELPDGLEARIDTTPIQLRVANGTVTVVPSAAHGAPLATEAPFADRLALVTAEAEAVAGIARDRATRREADGRPLSVSTLEHLGRLHAAIGALVTASQEQAEQPKVAGSTVDLMLRLYQEGLR